MGNGEKGSIKNAKQRISQTRPVNFEHEKLIEWFESVKFKKSAFGGIDEINLWKKLEELNGLYENALIAERARYDALLKRKSDGDE